MTVSIGDLIRCIDCGHEARVTAEWLSAAIRRPSPRMRHFVDRLKCGECGARLFEIVPKTGAPAPEAHAWGFGRRQRAGAD